MNIHIKIKRKDLKKLRKLWDIPPVQKVKKSDKVYSRAKHKRSAQNPSGERD